MQLLLQALVMVEADVAAVLNEVDDQGRTALHLLACSALAVDLPEAACSVALLLIDSGAQPNSQNAN
eukprot:SAG11_NODE_9684_length_890_cov_0.845765_1_plen_66_part_01